MMMLMMQVGRSFNGSRSFAVHVLFLSRFAPVEEVLGVNKEAVFCQLLAASPHKAMTVMKLKEYMVHTVTHTHTHTHTS